MTYIYINGKKYKEHDDIDNAIWYALTNSILPLHCLERKCQNSKHFEKLRMHIYVVVPYDNHHE